MYCSWLSKKTGKTYRLPTEAEWEYAVTGGEMQYFPWGNDYKKLSDSESVEDIIDTSFDKDIYSVDQYSLDRSIYGVCGMYGNAGEWCLDAYDPEYYFFAAYENPLQIIRKYLGDMSVRGSVGYRLENDTQGVKRRRFKSPVYNTNVMGFRIVEEVEQTVFNKGNISESIFYYRKGNIIVPKTIVYEKPEIKSDRLFEIDKDVEVKIYLKSIKKEKQEDWYCVEVIGVDKSEGLTGWIVGSELEIQEIVFKS
jgi:hypothetical protein